jgi:hypothetical protein
MAFVLGIHLAMLHTMRKEVKRKDG